jgi:hypothetical protein
VTVDFVRESKGQADDLGFGQGGSRALEFSADGQYLRERNAYG